MNRRTCVLLLATATLAACGQPPSPGTPRAVPQAEATTTTTVVTTTTTTTTTVVTPPPTTTTTPPPKPPPRTTTTTKPPPPPPKPPDRWVLPSGLRGSIEQRTGLPFPDVWAGMQDELAGACPARKVCVGYALEVDTSTDTPGDCVVVPKGIKVPNPLYEGGKIIFKVTSTLCPQG